MTADDTFDWGVLGKDWWMENAEAVHATINQAKFACARHAGATRTKAAELAGYSATDDQGLRTAGSRADDTKAVQDLLTMASAASVAVSDNSYTVAEARQKIGRMVKTSLDPSVVIKGTELLAKLDQVDRDRGQTPDDDGLSDWRLCRDFLCQENGASTWMLFYRARKGHMGHPANFPLLHDVYNIAQCEPFGQQIFDWCGRDLSVVMRQTLEQQLADRNYQIETRRKVWAERGIIIDDSGQAKLGNFPNAA